MNRSEILAFLNAHHVCQMATAEGDTPRVRSLLLYRADENGIIFMSDKKKALYKEICYNPKVELCFADPEFMVQVRVSGTIEVLEDLELVKEIIAARPTLKPLVEKMGYEPFIIYRVAKGIATVWTPATNFDPKSYIEL